MADTPADKPAPADRPLQHLWAWIVAFAAMNALAFGLGWPFVVIP